MDEFPAMTDQEAIRTLLMLPWAIGDNTEDGQVSYSANEIEDVLRFVNSLCDRAESAEAKLSICHDLLRAVPEHSAAWYADICDYLETC